MTNSPLKGNLQFGSSAVLFYDGSFTAGLQDTIVITFNYR
jgi:carboxylesterase type B